MGVGGGVDVGGGGGGGVEGRGGHGGTITEWHTPAPGTGTRVTSCRQCIYLLCDRAVTRDAHAATPLGGCDQALRVIHRRHKTNSASDNIIITNIDFHMKIHLLGHVSIYVTSG